MSKLVLFLTVPVVAGLAAWNLSLSSEIDDLRSQLAAGGRDASGEPGKADAKAAAEAARTAPMPRVVQQEMTALTTRLAEVEKRLPPPPAASDGAGGAAAAKLGEGAASSGARLPADVVSAFGSDSFKGAVAKVLDERDDARRKERSDRQAEAVARFLLRDLTVNDQQRADVKKLVAQSMEKVEKVRDDETLSDEQRREQITALQTERIDSLSSVLDAQQMESVKQRSAQARRVPGARGQGGAGNPGGGGRRGN